MNLSFHLDKNLREVPDSPPDMISYIQLKQDRLKQEQDLSPLEQVNLMGEMGYYCRLLEDLESAEKYLMNALVMIKKEDLGVRPWIVQGIRFSQVLQWKGDYHQSSQILNDILETCARSQEGAQFLDFAWEAVGKNLFEQGKLDSALEAFENSLKVREAKNAPQELMAVSQIAIHETRARMQKTQKAGPQKTASKAPRRGPRPNDQSSN